MTNDQDQFDLLRKINNFKKITQRQLATKLKQNKVKYMYILTPRGISKKTRLTINFMKLKLNKYYELKKELKKEK